MPAQSSIFPAFIRAEYDPSGGGFPEFEQAARASSDRARRTFETSFNEIQNIARQALAAPRLETGGLDIGTAKYREAAAAAQQEAIALRQVAIAAERAARGEGDLTEQTRLYLQAARSAALEAEERARAAGQEAIAMDRLQRELIEVQRASQNAAGGSRALALAHMNGSASARESQLAMVGVSQQLQDVVVGFQSGQRAAIILGQQLPQLAFAMQGLGGAAGRVGTLLAGPFGVAVFAAGAAVSYLVGQLGEAEDSLDKLVDSADSFGNAQSRLGQVMDLVTGKFEDHNIVLRETLRLQAQAAILDAQKEQRGLREAVLDFGQPTFGEAFSTSILGSGDRANPRAQLREYNRQIEERAPLNAVLNDFLGGKFATKDDPAGVQGAIRQIEALGEAGRTAGRDVIELKKAILTLGINQNDIAANEAVLKALVGEGLDPRLRKEGRTRKPRDRTKEIARLEEFGEDARDRIADIAGRFAGQPKLIEQIRKALTDLDDIIDDLGRKQPPGFKELIADAEKAKEVVRDGLNRPYREFIKSQEDALEVQRLLTQGREDEAEALRIVKGLEEQMGPISEARKQTIRDTVEAIRLEARETEIARQKVAAYLNALDDIRINVQQTIEGISAGQLSSIGDFAKGLQGTANRLVSEVLTEKLFGNIFRDLDDMVRGRKPVQEAGERMALAMDSGTTAVNELASAIESATSRINAAGSMPGLNIGSLEDMLASNNAALREGLTAIANAANDNGGVDHTVTSRRLPGLDPAEFMNRTMSSILGRVLGPVGEKIGEHVTDALAGVGIGQMAGGLILGRGGSSAGSAIGGALGQVAGKAMQETITGLLGKTLGQFAGPLGGIIGGIAGGLLGNALSGTKRASATIAFGEAGLGVASSRGNSRQRERASLDAADSAIAMIERIAEQLGGTLTGIGSVSIGVREGNFRVDPSGRGITKTKKGAVDFGEDAEAAVLAATLDLIKDGMIGGLRASTQNLLRGAKDLALGIEKALKFESVFVRLKEFTNPVGAALDALDKEFMGLVKIFEEAGASAAELADLQKLYELERAEAVKQASDRMTGALKGLLNDLTIGNETRSLRERLAAAMEAYNPLAADLEAGKPVDYDAFTEAARNVLDIQRQLSGSQSDYFNLEDEVRALTETALAKENAKIDEATKDTGTVTAIDRLSDRLVDQLGSRLDAVNDNLGRIIRGGSAGGPRTSFPEFRDRSHF